MEQYLRSFVTYLQDDWVDWLPMAEFAANNARNETTGTSPFLANYGQHPRMGFEPPIATDVSAPRQPHVLEVERFVADMNQLNDFLRDEMAWAQAVYEEKANQSRIPAPAYKVGDHVWLNLRNVKTHRPTKKLDWKNAGPYRIIKVVSPYAFKLKLPTTMRVHPVFHTSLLMPVSTELPLPGQHPEPPPPIEVDGEPEHLIERILDVRVRRRRMQYLVKWQGYEDPDSNTWEPEYHVAETQALDEFETRNMDKIRKLRTRINTIRTVSFAV
jgi:hypothetical protein